MSITISEVPRSAIESVIPILLQAEESEDSLRWALDHWIDAVYRMDVDAELVGAATMRWRIEPCEIMELAITSERQGQGLGKQFVTWLIAEARRRGQQALLVGTANSSLGNIAFYQRCGLRMDHVRKDYFWYHNQPQFENGLRIRDLLVFRYDISA